MRQCTDFEALIVDNRPCDVSFEMMHCPKAVSGLDDCHGTSHQQISSSINTQTMDLILEVDDREEMLNLTQLV
jgi:hypothetical protein